MKNFFNELEKELEKNNIANKDEILEKYQDRYQFGLQSGLSEEEILAMFGSPEEIAKEYLEKKQNEKVKKDLIIKTVQDDIVIMESSDDKIHFEFKDVNLAKYSDLKKAITETGVYFTYLKAKYLGLNRGKSGIFYLFLPKDINFKKIEITTTSGDIKIDSLQGSRIWIQTTSGNVEIKNLVSDKFSLKGVSGDVFCENLEFSNMSYYSVSGDLKVNRACGETVHIDTVSGDVIIEESNAKYSTSSISGDIKIGNKEMLPFYKKVAGVFRRDS